MTLSSSNEQSYSYNNQSVASPQLKQSFSVTKRRIYFFALLFITLSSFGNNYAFNNPQALHQSLKLTLHINQSQFQMLYSIFAFPNILSALFIGYLIDFFEIYRGFVILVFGVAFFQSIVAVGAYFESYTLMLIGRLFFGISSESLITAQAALISILFKRKGVALALGIVITFPQIGNALNSLLTYRFYQIFDEQLGGPFFVSVGFCTLCSIFAIIAVRFIKIINKAEEQQERLQLLYQQQAFNTKQQYLNTSFSSNSSQSSKSQIQQPVKQHIRIQDLKQLKYSFWILNLICTINLGMYIPFLDGANGLLQTRFKYSQQVAGQIIMVTYFSAALLSIPSGLLVDRIGMRRYISIFGAVLLLGVQLILYFSNHQTSIAVIILAFMGLGLGLALYANCVLASVSLIVNKKIMGTAFGIIQMMESVALSLFPLISGALVDQEGQSQQGYFNAQIFFIGIGGFGVFSSLGLFIFPQKQKIKLDQGRKKRTNKHNHNIISQMEIGSMNQGFGNNSLNKSLLSTRNSISENKEIQIQNLMNIYIKDQTQAI